MNPKEPEECPEHEPSSFISYPKENSLKFWDHKGIV